MDIGTDRVPYEHLEVPMSQPTTLTTTPSRRSPVEAARHEAVLFEQAAEALIADGLPLEAVEFERLAHEAWVWADHLVATGVTEWPARYDRRGVRV